ncbi:MAG: hypothetical protein KKB51_00550 [Candidatus Riflebacteria bacterium]|nr:hypothetical protein [Candidatus Riflebacteria bacterium]
MSSFTIAPLLFIALIFCSKKSYAWIIASALVIFSGGPALMYLDFPEEWMGLYIAQLVTGVMMVAGQLLRKADSGGFRLFFRARIRGTNDFSSVELLQLLHFTAIAKRTVMSVSIVLCVLAATGVMVVRLIESDRKSSEMDLALLGYLPSSDHNSLDTGGMGQSPAGISATSLAYPDSDSDKMLNSYADSAYSPGYADSTEFSGSAGYADPDNTAANKLLNSAAVLFPIFLPLLTGLIVAQFFLRVQDSSWFCAIPPEQLKREPVELPSYIWLFPALSVLIVWSNQIFAYLVAF